MTEMVDEKYFVVIKHDDDAFSIDVVDTEADAVGFVEHPTEYMWIRFIKGVELNLQLNPTLTLGDGKEFK